MGESVTWVFTIIAAIAAGWLFWYLLKPHQKSLVFAFSLLLGGATTHLLDRLFRDPGFARGHVVDFIDYNGWFVGNVADIALTFGALLAFVLTARQKDPAEEQAGEPAESRD
jgi:signal peptidase II